METNGTRAEKKTREAGPRAIGIGGRRVLAIMSVPVNSCSVSVSAGYCQLHPGIGKSTRGVVWRNGDGVDCGNKKGRAK